MVQTYKVARGVIRMPRKPGNKRSFSTVSDFIRQGEVIPEGLLDEAAQRSLLADGRIELVGEVQSKQAGSLPARRGKWSVDPTALVGKDLEDLLVMVLEIDETFDVSTLPSVVEAVRQLTMDWDPAFREEITRSTDRSRPERLSTSGAKAGANPSMSDAAEQALARAKERAQAIKEISETDDNPHPTSLS